jgi:glycerophosphoryl diester phosphodiesterase
MGMAIVVAHRGLHRKLPENSIPAFELAASEGLEWVECDVHASADGTPFILHDDTLERTTTGRGPIATVRDPELRALRLKDSSGAASDILIPTLREALKAQAGRTRWLVEIKPADAKSLVKEVISAFESWPGLCALQSFDSRNLVHAWTVDPSMPAELLVGNETELKAALAQSWPAVNIDHQLLTPTLIATLQARGTRIGAWTVNEPDDIRRVIQLGVDVIITDEPWRVRYALDELSR